MTVSTEPREFHSPGTFSKWFSRIVTSLRIAPPPPAMSGAERQKVRAVLDAERAAWAEQCSRRARRRADAQGHVDQAREFLRDAEAHLAAIDAEHIAASGVHDARDRGLEQRLRDGASAAIAEFVHDCLDQIELLRDRGTLQTSEAWGRPDPVTDRRPHRYFSNAESLERRRAALLAAISTAEALALELIGEDEIHVRLTTLRDGIPEVEGLLVTPGDVLTPSERRESAWRVEEAQR